MGMIKNIALISTCMVVFTHLIPVKADLPFEDWSVERRAFEANMSIEEFVFISSVVEAESDRSDSLEGRILIAETILNRVNDCRFPSTISEVLTQNGQFSTVRNGRSIVERTDYSDQAVMIAVQEIENNEAPNVLFFNCIGYNYGEPYDYVDGNYFMTLEE